MVKWNMNKMYDYCSNYGYDLPLMNQKYVNTSTKYLFVCKKHGIYEQTWNNHKNGSSCKECKNDKLRNTKKVYSDDDYISWCKNNTNIIPLDSYVNNFTKIRHKCLKCNYIWYAKPNNIKASHSGCPNCSGNLGRDYDTFMYLCKTLNVDLPIDKFKRCRSNDTLTFRCSTCGFIYKNKVKEHIRKDKRRIGCPRCKAPGSKGEKLIINLLKKYNINYEYPKVFSDFKSSLNKPYHFDFYLSDYNVLIEYQGIQHYEPQKFFGGTDRYERRVEIDKMKKEYSKSKGIKLICIPYTVNTENKLIKYLTNNS